MILGLAKKHAIFPFWEFYGTLQQLSSSGSLKCYRGPVQCWEGSFELLSARKPQKSFLGMMQEDLNESQRERWTGTQKGPLILFNPRKSPTASFLKRSIASSVVSSPTIVQRTLPNIEQVPYKTLDSLKSSIVARFHKMPRTER